MITFRFGQLARSFSLAFVHMTLLDPLRSHSVRHLLPALVSVAFALGIALDPPLSYSFGSYCSITPDRISICSIATRHIRSHALAHFGTFNPFAKMNFSSF